MNLYYPIEIDLYNIYPLKVITAQQNNIGRGAVITLKAAGVVIEPTGEEINLHAKKPDGTISYIPCTLSNGQIKVQFTNQMLALEGTVQVELQMISGSGADITDITTPIFRINVQPSNINEKKIESTNEFTALEQGLAEIEELKKNGLKGDAATIQVGTVTASEPGSNPQIKNVGTTTDAIFDFVLPRGVAGEEGPQGPAGKQSAYTLPRSQFPATGAEDTLYIDTSADPAMIYYWTGSEYKQAGGAGSGGGGSAAVVTFLRSGWTAGDSGYTQTMSVPGLTDAAEPQLQLPKNATDAQAAVWDSIKKSVPAAGNITLTVDSQPGTDLDVIVLSLPEQEGTAVGDIVTLSQRITAAQADADALRTDVDEINANLAVDEGVITSGNQVISYTRQGKLVTLDIRANDVTAGGTIATLTPDLRPASAQSRYIWVTTSASASGTTSISISTSGVITTTGAIYRATFSISYLCA